MGESCGAVRPGADRLSVSLIRDLEENAEDRSITEAIIAMAKTLSLTVIAEGVETQEQRTFLADPPGHGWVAIGKSRELP